MCKMLIRKETEREQAENIAEENAFEWKHRMI